MVKKIVFLILVLPCLFNLKAQEKSQVKLGIETGILPLSDDSENLGLFLNVEPKIKIFKNTFMGLRFGITLNSHTFENSDRFQFYIDEKFDHAVISFVPTFDYYLKENNYHPFVGVGLGYHLLPDPIEVYRVDLLNPSENVLDGSTDKRIGFLLRGGCEISKLRLGVEYNFIPKGDIKIPNGQIIGTVDNSYFGLSIGYVFGNGKNSN